MFARYRVVGSLSEEHDGDATRFRGDNAGGVVSRAWHNTSAMMRRQCLWVLDNPDLGIASEHLGIYTPGIREVYWKHTGDALQDAFNGDDYLPDLSERYSRGQEKVVKLPAWFFTIPR
jgi:hypothetical protein